MESPFNISGAFSLLFDDSEYTDRTKCGFFFVRSPGAAVFAVGVINCNRTRPQMARPGINFKNLPDIIFYYFSSNNDGVFFLLHQQLAAII
jgi:hypothetical protein